MPARDLFDSLPQSGLFDAGPQLLFDDELGRISYQPGFLAEAAASGWFEAMQRDIPWQSQRRQMYDREVDVPRLLASYALDDRALPAPIAAAAARVREATAVDFNSVGLNLYRDGRDSVAPHNDHLNEMVQGQPIALLSFGATRTMVIRAKAPPRRVLRLPLESGSLLMMSYATQHHYDHGIPKLDAPVGPRISLAFRVRPANLKRGRYAADKVDA